MRDTLLLLLLEKECKLSSALDRKHLRSRFTSQYSPLPSEHQILAFPVPMAFVMLLSVVDSLMSRKR